MSAIATHISVEPGSEAFPLLTPAQIERLRPHGKLRHVEAGEVLFEPGDSNVPVYVVLSGGLEILQPCPKDGRTLVRHVPGSITGEFAVISGQRALLRGQVIASGEFLQIASGEFRALVAKDAELGDILMKAYILRRMLLISEEASNALVLGSLNCANTLRLREFLGRNGYPYKFIDLDTDERSQSILDHFQVKVDEVPVVICNGRSVLRNPSIRELADCLGLNVSIDESQVRDLIVVGAGPSGLAAGSRCILILIRVRSNAWWASWSGRKPCLDWVQLQGSIWPRESPICARGSRDCTASSAIVCRVTL